MAGGGGAWKVAYADFVTAMMAFFLVMWITAQSKPIKESIAHYFNDPFAAGPSTRPNGSSFQRTSENGDAPYKGAKGRSGRSKKEVASKKKETEQAPRGRSVRRPSLYTVHGGDRAHVGTVLLFDENLADLSKESEKRLNEVLPLLAGKPNKIEIRSHASGRPLAAASSYHSIWELCFARCVAAMQYLRDHGIEPERLRLSQAGPYEPQALEGDHARMAENSRVEVYMLGEHVDDLRGNKLNRIVENEEAEEGVELQGDPHSEAAHGEPVRDPAAEGHQAVPAH